MNVCVQIFLNTSPLIFLGAQRSGIHADFIFSLFEGVHAVPHSGCPMLLSTSSTQGFEFLHTLPTLIPVLDAERWEVIPVWFRFVFHWLEILSLHVILD